jgi:hypothetical protein
MGKRELGQGHPNGSPDASGQDHGTPSGPPNPSPVLLEVYHLGLMAHDSTLGPVFGIWSELVAARYVIQRFAHLPFGLELNDLSQC